MKKIFVFLLIGYSFLISQTKIWKQSTIAEFSLGTTTNVTVTSVSDGELQLVHPFIQQKSDTLDNSIPRFASYDDAGNYAVGWINNKRVYVQKFSVNKQPLTTAILVDDSARAYDGSSLGIALLNSGKFFIGWCENQGYSYPRYGQFFDENGGKIGSNLRLFSISNGTTSYPQPIADKINERYVFVSPEGISDNSTFQLYAHIYSADAIKIRDSIDIVTVGSTKYELWPNGAMYNGKLILTWIGDNDGSYPMNVYAAIYDSNCVSITSPILLNSSSQKGTVPIAAIDEKGNYCITWIYPVFIIPGPPSKIYGQILDPSGGKIGGVIQFSNLKEGNIYWHNLIFTNNVFRATREVSFSNGQPSQQWISYWKLEQITNGNYISSVFDAGSSKITYGKIFWSENTSPATRLKFQIRSAESSISIPTAQWNGPTSAFDYYTNPFGETISTIHNSKRFIQVKGFFETDSVGISPVLTDFGISFTPSDTVPPLTPACITVKGEHRRIAIEWIKSTSVDVKKYRIYRVLGNSDIDTALFAEVSAENTSFIDSSVVYSTQYRYGITAIDSTFNESAMEVSMSVSPMTMTIFVSSSGSSQGEGTAAKPLSKINDAIKFSGEGDTIFVLPGEYSETMVLKDGISLIGSNPMTTKILSSSSSSVLETGKNNVVQGFSFLIGSNINCGGENVLITENILVNQGGGYVAISAGSKENVVISKNIIMNFSIGIQDVATPTPSSIRTTVRNNIIRCGTGVQNVWSNMAFINNTFIVEGSSGVAISFAGGTATILNNCFAGYPSEGGYIRSLMSSMGASYSFQYNNKWNLTGDQPDSLPSTNISIDPQFKSVSKNNFHLQPSSLCRDNGNPASAYNDRDGSRNDIGAYGGPDPLPEYLTFSLATDLALNNVSGFPGDTVAVDVLLSTAAGLKNAIIDIQFDHSIMTFYSAIPTSLTQSFTITSRHPFENKVTLAFNGETEISSGGGSISTLKYILSPTVESDKRSTIEIGAIDLLDGEDNRIYISSVTNGSCIVQARISYPHKVFVDGSYIGIEDGTILHPYSTIQNGIGNAQLSDTVVVAAGKYIGPITMRSKIVVMGLGANATTIECPNDPFISIPTVVRFNNVDSTGITGFSLVNYASLGTVVEIMSSRAVVVSMNKIDQSGMAMYSIVVSSDSRVVIQDNYFVESKFGGSSMIHAAANDVCISRNVFSPSSSQELVVLNADAHATITNNRFYLTEEGMTGLTGMNTRQMLVANNLFYGGTSSGFGMKLIDAESTLVVNNIFDIRKTGIDENNGTQQIYNNIFIKNSIALNLPSSTEHQYNLFWDNRLNFGNGQQDSTEVLINPQFINQESGNYKLASSSPALNSGHPEIRWNDNNGTRNDIGLYGGPYADTTMFALLNSRLCIGNVPGNPGDTVVVPIYAIDAAGISGVQILVSYDAGRLSLLEAHTTTLTQDFVLLRKHIGSSIIELMLQGYRSIFLDSGSIIEITFVVSKNASGNIPLKFQNVQLIGASTQTVQGISFENGEIVLSSNSVRLVNSNIPKEFALYQNYPNPFNPSTIIKYSLPRTANVQVKIFDILGRELVILWNKEQQAGTYQITYNASTLSSGIYFYQLRAGDFLQTKKMLLLK